MVRIKTFIDEPRAEAVAKDYSSLISDEIKNLNDFSYDGLLNRGLITVDQLASYINSVSTSDYWAFEFQNKISTDNCAKLLNNTNITADRAGSILASTNISISKINEILINTNITADRVQSILKKMVDLGHFERIIDIVTYNASNVRLTSNITYTGVQRFRNLDLNGYTYTADGQPHVIIAYSINIPSNSKISKTQTGGAGGIYGSNGEAGVVYVNIGDDYTSKGGNCGGSWGGGGGPDGYGYGRGGPITVNTVDLLKTNLYALVDWYIVNVLGKTPSSTESFTNSYNAGGGSGVGNVSYGGRGAGGLIIFCNSLNCSGSIEAIGGNGSSTLVSGITVGGGGGGGGGIIYIYSSTITCNTISVVGGNGDGGSGSYSDGGGGGAGGIVYVFYRNYYIISSINVSGGAGGYGYTSGSPGQPGFYKIIKF